MKTINMFGRKMPMVAILMALLVVGTASATVFYNYATLDGDADVVAGISVWEYGAVSPVEIGGTGILEFEEQEARFTIENDYDGTVHVEFVTTVMNVTGDTPTEILENEEMYFSVEYSDAIGVIENTADVTVPGEGLIVTVELMTAPNVEGTYNVEVAINPVIAP